MQTQRRFPRSEEVSESVNTKDDDNAEVHRLEGDPIVGELRKLYDGIIDEPVPDQLLDLLRQLDEVERNR